MRSRTGSSYSHQTAIDSKERIRMACPRLVLHVVTQKEEGDRVSALPSSATIGAGMSVCVCYGSTFYLSLIHISEPTRRS
eukprot:7378573-Prymnesium_polylepis.1